MASEFPGYYVINGRKVTPHGEPYKKGKEDELEVAAESQEVAELKAQLATAQAERDAALAAVEKPADPPKPPAAPKPAPGTVPPAN